MKIFNKFIWSKKEPSNKNDVWFDGSTWKMYTEEAWQSFTLPVDAADKVAKMLENASEVYQEKLNAGYGIVIEGNTISLDVSSIDIDTTHNIGSIELFDQLIKDGSRYNLHEDDIKAIQEGKLITTTKFGTKIPVLSVNHMMQSSTSTSIAGYILVFYVDAVLYNMSIYDFEIVGGLSWKTHLDSLAPESYFSSNSYNAIQNAIVTKKFEETDAKFTELEEQTTEQLTELSAEINNYETKVTDITSSFVEEKTLFYRWGDTTYIWTANNDYYWRLYKVEAGETLLLRKKAERGTFMAVECDLADFVVGGKLGNLVIEQNAPLGDYTYDNTSADTKYVAILYKYYSYIYFEVFMTEAISIADKVRELAEEVASNGVLIEDLQNSKIDREADDYYPKLAVGLADNLAGVDVVDSEINFRRSGGGAITDGVARIETIKGNSVVWNQCFAYGRPAANHAWENNRLTLNGTWDASTQVFDTIGGGASFIPPIQGHKSLLCIKHISGRLTSGSIDFFNPMNGTVLAPITPDSSPKEYAAIVVNNNGAYWDYRNISASTSAENLTIEITAYDLTQMFGSGNEPTTIEEFYQRIPMGVDLNAYNEGEVIHMDVQSIESQGVNAWDEEWQNGAYDLNNGTYFYNTKLICSKNAMRCVGNANYRVTALSGLMILWYDLTMGYLGYQYAKNQVITAPSNAVYFHLRSNSNGEMTTYNHDICINISDTAINGKYFPYIKRVEDLSIIRKYFPQGMKSAGTAHDEIRYNKASGKWEKVVRIGEVKMKDLKWDFNTNDGSGLIVRNLKTQISNIAASKTGIAPNVLTPIYDAVVSDAGEKGIAQIGTTYFFLYDDTITSLAIGLEKIGESTLYYELAEPIVTELDAEDQFKDLDYQVWNGGTEKAIAEGKSAPLAADITYGFNAIGKIKELESLVAALRAKVGI